MGFFMNASPYIVYLPFGWQFLYAPVQDAEGYTKVTGRQVRTV